MRLRGLGRPGASSRTGLHPVATTAPSPAESSARCSRLHASASAIASRDGASAATIPGGFAHARFARGTALHYKSCACKAAGSASAARFTAYRHAHSVGEFFELHPGPPGVARADLRWNLPNQLCSAPNFDPPGRLKSYWVDDACGSTEFPAPVLFYTGARPTQCPAAGMLSGRRLRQRSPSSRRPRCG